MGWYRVRLDGLVQGTFRWAGTGHVQMSWYRVRVDELTQGT